MQIKFGFFFGARSNYLKQNSGFIYLYTPHSLPPGRNIFKAKLHKIKYEIVLNDKNSF